MPVVDVPFIYRAVAVLGRKRSSEVVDVLDSVPVVLAEVSSKDAPPCGPEVSSMVAKRYRALENRLFEPLLSGNGGPVSADLADPSYFRGGESPFAPRGIAPVPNWFGTAKPLEEIAPRKVLADDRDARLAALMARARDVVSVEGALHAFSQGPVFGAVEAERGKCVALTMHGRTTAAKPALVFHRSERDVMKPALAAAFKRVDDRTIKIDLPEGIETSLSPAAMAYEGLVDAIKILDDASMRSLPVEALLAIADMREASAPDVETVRGWAERLSASLDGRHLGAPPRTLLRVAAARGTGASPEFAGPRHDDRNLADLRMI